ncbi:FAD-dependent oxidoreductase [Maribellus mangrovi]|uniref:FAD-dependent oxidoreductase n=1 Tax=Maribellus mangrovi TaxID=3133146 RepID=UPI0030EBB3B8
MDKYTKHTIQHGLSRRSFLSRAAIASAAGLVSFSGCTPDSPSEEAFDEGVVYGRSADDAAKLSFLPKPEKINEEDISSTETYDVVVVGAGASGVPAALSALENGASVAVLQKENIAISQGNSGAGIDLESSDKAGVEALVSRLMKDNAHRCNPKLLREWAYNSGEAVSWVIDRAQKAGAKVINQGNLQQVNILEMNGYKLGFHTAYFGSKPYTNGDGMRDLAAYAEKQGVQFFYSTPAVQLVQNELGEITGVIGKGEDSKYIKFLAKKGVILATGDYQNNKAMCDYFVPDARNFGRKQINKTGDGFVMGYWAGGVIEPIGHTKMLHDFDAGPATMCDMPFLAVDHNGKRFVDESVEMSLLNNYLRGPEKTGQYSQIFDSNYMTQAKSWPGVLVPPEALKNYMPDEQVPDRHGVYEAFINTHKADTIEELAVKIEADPATLSATVKRYNELAEAGEDPDFGKSAEHLKPIDTPPFYGIHRTLRLSAVCSGLLVDENHQCLNAEGSPIKGLYAIGNLGGGFYGGVDYPLTVYGLSLGRCYTFGYLAGRHVANLQPLA